MNRELDGQVAEVEYSGGRQSRFRPMPRVRTAARNFLFRLDTTSRITQRWGTLPPLGKIHRSFLCPQWSSVYSRDVQIVIAAIRSRDVWTRGRFHDALFADKPDWVDGVKHNSTLWLLTVTPEQICGLLLMLTGSVIALIRNLPGQIWEVGVEVKVERSDFLSGLNGGQFSRYDKDLCGLYIAGPANVVKAKEVPPQYGVLHVGSTGQDKAEHIVCSRHPTWKPMEPLTADKAWRIIWAIAKQMRSDQRNHESRALAVEHKIKGHAGRAIWSALKSIGDNTETI